MDISQRKLIANAFIISHFSYCPLIWMFYSRVMGDRINKIHERTLRLYLSKSTPTNIQEAFRKKQDH